MTVEIIVTDIDFERHMGRLAACADGRLTRPAAAKDLNLLARGLRVPPLNAARWGKRKPDSWLAAVFEPELTPSTESSSLPADPLPLPCPFCGGNDILFEDADPNFEQDRGWVCCNDCRGSGPSAKGPGRRYLIEAWNRRADRDSLEHALDELVKLQAHYAKLLNGYDGGARRQFATKEEWLARVAECEGRANQQQPEAILPAAEP